MHVKATCFVTATKLQNIKTRALHGRQNEIKHVFSQDSQQIRRVSHSFRAGNFPHTIRKFYFENDETSNFGDLLINVIEFLRVNSYMLWSVTNSVFQNGIRPAIVVWHNAPSLDINPNELHSLHHSPSYMPGSQTHTYPPGEGWHELQWLSGSLHASMSARIESLTCNFWKGQIYGKIANNFIIQLFSNFPIQKCQFAYAYRTLFWSRFFRYSHVIEGWIKPLFQRLTSRLYHWSTAYKFRRISSPKISVTKTVTCSDVLLIKRKFLPGATLVSQLIPTKPFTQTHT